MTQPIRRRRTGVGSRKSRRARFSVIGSDVDYVSHVVATVDLPLGFDRRPAPSRRHTLASSAAHRRRSRASRGVAPDFRGTAAPFDDDDDDATTTTRQRRKTAFAALGRVREDEPQAKEGDIATAPSRTPVVKVPESGDEEEESESDSEDEEETSSSTAFAVTFALLVASGVGANVAFERLNVLDPGCGQVFTLLQYVATVAEKSPDASSYLRRPAIPPTVHVACVALMFFTAAWGNACLSHDLNFATYLIIKNCNLVFSMVVGAIFLGRRYRWGQVASVVLVSVGVICSVLSQQKEKAAAAETDGDDTTGTGRSDGLVGAALCAASTLSMACLGCLQEHAFARYGGNKDDEEDDDEVAVDAPSEALFYTHLLGLTLFLAPGGGLGPHARALSSQWRRAVPLGVLNVCSVVLCKRCFFELLDRSSSLTATLAITVYRFVGIVVSACGLASGGTGGAGGGGAVPTAGFWAGAVSVGVGSVSYLFASDRGKTGTSSASSSSSSATRKRQ